MDLLDPLGSGTTTDDVKTLNIEEHIIESDEEVHAEHLSPQTLLETPHENIQCTYRSADGIAYSVLKVENESGQILPGTTFTSAAVPQIITGNLNGQVYLIGNSNELFVGAAPTEMSETLRISTRPETHRNIRVSKKDERRRMTHNEVERRRRDKINNWITKLSKIIPEPQTEVKGNGHYDGQSKGGILAKACEYIMELRESHQQLEQCLKENKRLEENMEQLKEKNNSLETENEALRAVLRQHGIEVSITELAS